LTSRLGKVHQKTDGFQNFNGQVLSFIHDQENFFTLISGFNKDFLEVIDQGGQGGIGLGINIKF